MKLVFANRDYGPAGNGWGAHLTDEGLQLQLGLEHAGWTLAGAGYGDGCRDVAELLERHKPEAVFVQDVRDWSPDSPGAFRKDVGFINMQQLAARRDILRVTVCKDAGTAVRYQQQFAETLKAEAIVHYYHERSILPLSSWLRNYRLIRTYHSVDAEYCNTLPMVSHRMRGVVSGAQNPQVYPLRAMVTQNAKACGLHVIQFPRGGYSNTGCRTPEYLLALSQYKVHFASASAYGFALRKLVESVAVGCTPVTDLPSYDSLPGIDSALIRVPQSATLAQVREAIDFAENAWNFDERMEYARLARELYDFRVQGALLDQKIMAVKVPA